MIRFFVRPVTTGVLLLLFWLHLAPEAGAQSSAVVLDPPALIAEAVAAHGVTVDSARGGEFVGRLLYVKLPLGSPILQETDPAARLSSPGLVIRRVASFGMPVEPADRDRMGIDADRRRAEAEYRLAHLLVVEFDGRLSPVRAATTLSASPDVLLAEPVPVARTFGRRPEAPNDPHIPDQKQLDFIRAEEAWSVESGDSSVVVGVVDAGMTAGHEDLKDNIAVNWGETGTDDQGEDRRENGVDDDGNGYVDDWKGVNLIPNDEVPPGGTQNGEHGTQVCGYVGATTDNDLGIAGVGNQCRFFPIKAAPFRSSAIVGGYNGILYAARRGFQVVNCSWGNAISSQIEQEIIDQAIAGYDIVVVAAGGNDVGKIRFFPAGYRNVLGVAGINDLRNVTTTWGEHIDLAARAGLTTSDLNLYFDLSSASSYATPVVSGVVALVRSAWPELSAAQVIQHIRNTAVSIESFNLGREGFVGRGVPDAFRAVSSDPMARPGIVLDSVWVVDLEGNRTDSLQEGEEGRIMVALSNLLGDATGVALTARLYTDDSTTVTLDPDPLVIGDLASGQQWTTPVGFPITIGAPGRRSISIRFAIDADDFRETAYELVAVRRNYIVRRSSQIGLTITSNGKAGVDYSEGAPVGEGVTYLGLQQVYESGLIVATDQTHLLDNVRTSGPSNPNDDLRAISTSLFPVPVDAAVEDREGESDYVGLRLGLRGETFERWPGLMRVGLFVENRSATTIDSLRLALFADWDLDEASENQMVSTATVDSLSEAIFPVTGTIRSGLSTNVWAALEVGRREAGREIAPLFYAILNGGDPLVIFDGFSDEEKFRTVSNGVGNRSAGPGDVSLVLGGVIASLEAGSTDSLFLLVEFMSGEGSPEQMLDYARDRYGDSDVPAAFDDVSRPRVSVNREQSELTVSGVEGATALLLTDLRGRVILRHAEAFSGTLRLPVGTLPSGRYTLIVSTDDKERFVPVTIIR